MTEDHARTLTTCPGCGEEKNTGLVVCWGCFKHGTSKGNKPAFKYANMDLNEWLRGDK